MNPLTPLKPLTKPIKRLAEPEKKRKRCGTCRKQRLLKFFHMNKKYGTYDRQSSCKECQEKTNAKWRAKNPHYGRRRAEAGYWTGPYRWIRIKDRYGLTQDQYKKLLKKQNGVCALCGGRNGGKHLVVDHCHATNVVRGLLCGGCNTSLGLFERKGWADRARAYLSRSGENIAIPKKKRNFHYVEAFGEKLTMAEWGRKLGIRPNVILRRLKRGWSPERAVQ